MRIRIIYACYTIALALAGWGIIANLQRSNVETLPSINSTSYPIDNLRFYSASLPSTASDFISNWFNRKNILTITQDNFVVRDYSELLDISSSGRYKDIVFFVDLKQPHVSYKIYTQINLSTSINPMTYITCAEGSDQRGDPSKCEGMTQI